MKMLLLAGLLAAAAPAVAAVKSPRIPEATLWLRCAFTGHTCVPTQPRLSKEPRTPQPRPTDTQPWIRNK